MTLVNDGDLAGIILDSTVGRRPIIKGAGLDGEYVPTLIIFRWASTNDQGSEHSLDGVKYPIEIQIFALNVKYSEPEAFENVDSYLVLSILGENTTKPLKALKGRGLSGLVADLPRIRQARSSTQVASPPLLSKLLPASKDRFIRYEGSLPFPPDTCDEIVTWIVFTSPVAVTDVELTLLRQLQGADGNPLLASARPVQPLNGRQQLRRGAAARPGQASQPPACKTPPDAAL